MKVAITGGSGFIGKEFLKHAAENFELLSISRSEDSAFNCKVFSNLFDVSAKDLAGVDVIIHLAGIAHSKSISCIDYSVFNTNLTLHLAQEAVKANVKRFVFVSSIGVNGLSTNQERFLPNDKPAPHNSYAKSKLDAEIGLKAIECEKKLEIVIIRPTLVYGINAPGNFSLLVRLVKLFPLLPFGLIDNKRDFISVQNLADLLVVCAKHPDAAGNIFLASDGYAVSTKDFTNAIARGLNKPIFQLPIPASFISACAKIIGKSTMVEQLLGNLEVDNSNCKDILNWQAPLTMTQALSYFNKD
ncbi:NAD-dependent epimerase/dehydratase family protein [Aeromonas popoffii]|uniref:NAD-dependent epimerase/dehydratase family protein n=1 Tax=Aeromonas popoffii TaxID=70856 RepID=UPI0030CDF8A8